MIPESLKIFDILMECFEEGYDRGQIQVPDEWWDYDSGCPIRPLINLTKKFNERGLWGGLERVDRPDCEDFPKIFMWYTKPPESKPFYLEML